jgi:aminoglycoside phosphotransferase (APT) family kinase protein
VEPRFIDWEWVTIGDPAQDLAYVGGQVFADPWYVPLSPAALESFVATYCAIREIPHGRERTALSARRDAWEVQERFLSSLHFRSKVDAGLDTPQRMYRHAVARITAGLTEVLGE